MKYVLIFQESPEDLAASQDPERTGAYWQAWNTYMELLGSHDENFSGAALQGIETATTVRGAAGAVQIHDGPYAETKEHLGGFCVVELDSLDTAIELAKACPAVKNGAVEVRPALHFDD